MGGVLSRGGAVSAEDREFAYSTADFEQVRSLLYQRAGISLAASKESMVYSRLARRLRALRLTSFGQYFTYLHEHEDELEQFTNALTTNLTSFFREEHHFPMLAAHLQRLYREQRRPLRIWCTASSTGEEPYSLAMTAVEAFDSSKPPVTILASDIDTKVLAHAAAGIYELERLSGLDEQRKRRFFLRGRGSHEGQARVKDVLRQLLQFRQINLLAPDWPVKGGLDAIFCRNVMIYFDRPTQLQLLERLMPLLQPQGLFFAGHSESFGHAGHLVKLIGRTVYRHARVAP